MPIKIPSGLPARDILDSERIFALEKPEAERQRVRPLKLVILNLMPKKIETEPQLLRLISKSPLQVEIDFMKTSTHEATHVSADHLVKFYENLDAFKDNYYDGFVVTGAPVEHMPFEDVDYWDELCQIMDWTTTHVHSTLHICWGAQAGLFHHYGIPKYNLGKKLFGVFPHRVEYKNPILLRGFDDVFMVPHSRHTTVRREDIERVPELKILASSEQAGVYAIFTAGGRQIFLTGHAEYDPDTLRREYERDKALGLPIAVPENYFPGNDDTKPPLVTWRSHANLLFSNWLNYFVYQTTPYDFTF